MKSTRAIAKFTIVPAVVALSFAGFNLPTASAQTPDAVTIDKQPIVVRRRYYEDDNATKRTAKTPRTDWQFRCLPQISYDIVENRTATDGKTRSVILKIKAISLKLSLPIVMRISKSEPRLTVEHEFGHVEICADVYDNADRLMRDYASSMLGKSYSGAGQTDNDACAAALKTPLAQISERFTTITNDKAKRISQFYDHLDATTMLAVKTQIRLAQKKEAARSLAPR